MRALLDVNVVIALLDPDHAFHERAHDWWELHAKSGWASCPLTENGVVRIMSNPAYSPGSNLTAGDLISRLRLFAQQTNHEFWPDDISLRDESVFDVQRIHGSRQIADLYLLALAARHKGRVATFDRGIPLSAVTAAKAGNLVVI
jgi:toxin-antitoxin system PIN domain toxin